MSAFLSTNDKYKILLERDVKNLFLRKTQYQSGSWSLPHRHENARFVLVLKGDFTENYAKSKRFCRPFTCIFRPPLEKHSEVYNDGVVCLSVDVSPLWLKRLENYSIKLNQSKDVHSRRLIFPINRLCNEMLFDDDVSALAIDALLTEIAVETHRSLQVSTKEKSPRWLKTVIEYIHENFSTNLTLNEIALVADVHPVHLARVFRNTYSCTIAEYIRRIRIESASRMLMKADLTLAQIASENGFTDQSHFTKVFKRLTNKTPADFKKTCGKAN